MRFREIVRFEVGYRLRDLSTWLYLLLLLSVALLLAAGADPLISSLNAPVNIATWTLGVGLLGILVTAALFVEAGHREARWRMEPLFYTTPLRAREYLGGRFLGAMVVNALLLLAVPAGLLLSTLLPTVRAGMLGPFRFEAYLLPYLFFLLPNLLINAALLFGVTVLTRRSLPGYLGALGLIAAYLFTLNLSVGLEDSPVLALLDPTGGVAMMGLTEGWTPIEQNTRLVVIQGLLLWNRVLWSAVACAFLAWTYRRFRLPHTEPGSARRPARGPAGRAPATRPTDPAPPPPTSISRDRSTAVVPSVRRTFGFRTRIRQTLATAGMAARQTILRTDFLLMAVGFFFLTLFWGLDSLNDPVFGSPRWPITGWVVSGLTGSTIRILIAILTVFYAGELVWREREAAMQELKDTRPVPDWTRLGGTFLALGLLLVLVQAVLMTSGLVLQTLRGYHDYQLGLYLVVLFGLRLADYLLFAVLALLVHVLVNQKYLGHIIAMLLFLAILQHQRLGLEHSLLVYGSDPGWAYSDLSGFGPFIGPWAWFKLYWTFWALLMGLVALLFWVRGTGHGLRERLRLARRRARPGVAALGIGVVLLTAATGGFIFYNTNVVNEYRTAWEAAEVEAEYERRYKSFQDSPQPWVAGVRLHVELYPERGAVVARGTYRLVNRTDEAVDSVHLSSFPYPELSMRALRFDREADLALEDDEHGFRIYHLGRPLQPGDSLLMEFDVELSPRGFRQQEVGAITSAIRAEGTYLQLFRLLPAIGYQRNLMEITSSATRREHGLPPRSYFRPIDDPRARRTPRSSPTSDWIEFDATVGTAADQVAVLPGTLEGSWTRDGRRYFHYRADAPIINSLSLMSARYAVHEAGWRDVVIRVLHHPDHAFNVGRAVRAVRASLEYYSNQFAPYSHRQFQLVEIPASGSFGRAIPGGMVYTETSPMAIERVERDDEDGLDAGYLIIAHEVAHQWWGHQLVAADVEGSQMLSETLAQYSALMVVERNHGIRPVRHFLRSMQLGYLSGRGSHRTPEVPLLRTGDHEHVHYRKGVIAMYALQDYLGEDRVNQALRALLDAHGMAGPPYPTTTDLYRQLQKAAPDSLRYLLHDLLATITLWNLRTHDARASRVGHEQYQVTLDVEATKLRADSVGNETEVPMDDLVEIGVFDEDGEALYLRKHRVASGRQSITVTVNERPATAGVDPYHKLIARHRDTLLEGKVRTVQIESAHPRDTD